LLADVQSWGARTYVPERRDARKRRWTDKPEGHREAFHGNRRRCRGARGKKLQRLRSEHVERTFAHVCETGGARRSWVRGLPEVTKRYLMQVAGHNLGVLMRKLFGIGKPRALQGLSAALLRVCEAMTRLIRAILSPVGASIAIIPFGRLVHRFFRASDTDIPPRAVAA